MSQYAGHQPNRKVKQGSSLCQLRAQTAADSHYWRDPELGKNGSQLARVISTASVGSVKRAPFPLLLPPFLSLFILSSPKFFIKSMS